MPPRHRPVLALLSLAALLHAGPAGAQTRLTVRATAPDATSFPAVSVFVSVWDEAGDRVSGLGPSGFEVLEDGVPITSASVQEVEVGVRMVFAINLTGGMRVRDQYGISRLDQVRTALLTWWQSPEAGILGLDDLTLVTSEGVLVSHSSAAAQLASSLSSFTAGGAPAVTDLDLVLQALDFAADPGPRSGMPAILVFLTPLPAASDDLALVNAIARANDSGAVVYPVLVGPAEAATVPQASGLRQLAEGTGGSLLVFDPLTGLTALKTRSLGRRMQYRIIYDSQASTSGAHSVQVRLTGPEFEGASEPREFEVSLLPPEVALIEPPATLERRSDDLSVTVEDLPPTSVPIRLLITFPDGNPRPVVGSRLMVDGVVVAERNEEPFDELVWDLTGVRETTSSRLRASVVDSLGLQGFSTDAPVTVRVVEPPRGLAALRPALGPMLVVAVILTAGIAVAVWFSPAGRRRAAAPERGVVPLPRRRLRRAGLQPQPMPEEAEASLVPLEQELPPFLLTGADVHAGRDASLATMAIDDPSVSGVHAKFVRLADGDYVVRDLDSVAGTWVNHVLVPPEGLRLHHGDVISLGRASYRFIRASAPPPRPIRVEPIEPWEARRPEHPRPDQPSGMRGNPT